MRAIPFACLRPRPEHMARFAALPYDVYDRASAAKEVARNPRTFLSVDRPEATLDPLTKLYSQEVYDNALAQLRSFVADGTLIRDNTPCFYIYRLEANGRTQTGVVAACHIHDYELGTLAQHENVREEKVIDRKKHILTTGCQTGPVFCAYRDEPLLTNAIAAVCETEPLGSWKDEHEVTQTVWRVEAHAAAAKALSTGLDAIPRAYIADGHHRAASADDAFKELWRLNGRAKVVHNGADHLLCVLFPASELTLLPYNRAITDLWKYNTEEHLIRTLETVGFNVGPRQSEPIKPTKPRHFGMWAFGAWRAISIKPESEVPHHLVDGLDVSVLQFRVLSGLFDISSPLRSDRIRFIGGVEGTDALVAAAGKNGAAFTLNAVPIEVLLEAGDRHLKMPAKSTWFEPKLRSGLFIRHIDPTVDLGKADEA